MSSMSSDFEAFGERPRRVREMLAGAGGGASSRHQAHAAGSDALASIRPSCLRSAQNSDGILARREFQSS
jgi:hypothetical protein